MRGKQPWLFERTQLDGHCVPPCARPQKKVDIEKYKPPQNWISELANLLATHSGSDKSSIENNIRRHTTGGDVTAKKIKENLIVIYAILCKKIAATECGFYVDQNDPAAIRGIALQLAEGLPNCGAGAFERVTKIRGQWEVPFSFAGLLQTYRTEIVETLARQDIKLAKISQGMEVHFVHAYTHYATVECGLDLPGDISELRHYNETEWKNQIVTNIKNKIKERYTPLGMVRYIEERLRNQYGNVPVMPIRANGQTNDVWRAALDEQSGTLLEIAKNLHEMLCGKTTQEATQNVARFLVSKKITLEGRPPTWIEVYTEINWPEIRKAIYERLCEEKVIKKSQSLSLSVALHPDPTCGSQLQEMLLCVPMSSEFSYWFLHLASDQDILHLCEKARKNSPTHIFLYYTIFRMDGGYEKLSEVITRLGNPSLLNS